MHDVIVMVEAVNLLQTDSNIHTLYLRSLFAPSLPVDMHMSAPLYIITPTKLTKMLIMCNFGSVVESKWCHDVMVDIVNQCRLLPTFILDVIQVFGHLPMLSICTWGHPYTVTAAKLAQRSLEICESVMWLSQNDAWCHSHGWGCKPLKTASNIHIRHLQSTHLPVLSICKHPYIITPTDLAKMLVILGQLLSPNDAMMSWLRLWTTADCFQHPY